MIISVAYFKFEDTSKYRYKRRFNALKNLLVAFCGLDGSGKTTQLNLLADWLESNHEHVFKTRQPGDFYRQNDKVRAYLDDGIVTNMHGIALLAAADRQFHISEVIEPNLQQGHVLCDRYLYSSIAFFKARGENVDYIKAINKDIPEPDLTVFIDISPEEALRRIALRDAGQKTLFEEQDTSVFVKVRDAFLENIPSNALIIDGTQSKTAIQNEIISEFKRRS